MNLEQRVEALEQAVRVLVGGELAIDNGQVFIKKAFIQGAEVKAVDFATAEYALKSGVNYDAQRERHLDSMATLMRDSQHLSRL